MASVAKDDRDQFEFPMQPHQKYHFTQHEELGFS